LHGRDAKIRVFEKTEAILYNKVVYQSSGRRVEEPAIVKLLTISKVGGRVESEGEGGNGAKWPLTGERGFAQPTALHFEPIDRDGRLSLIVYLSEPIQPIRNLQSSSVHSIIVGLDATTKRPSPLTHY
jgi:hypothetical protein